VSPQRKGSKRGSRWRAPRDRREIIVAVLASLAVIVVTAALVWFLRPNQDSGSSPTEQAPATTVATGEPTTLPSTTAPADGTVAPTTAPAATSTP
jgi:hypothetical protein